MANHPKCDDPTLGGGGRQMRSLFCAFMFAVLQANVVPAIAEDANNDRPIVSCDDPTIADTIKQLSRSDTMKICHEMLKVLEGVKVSNVREFSTVVFLFSLKGYEEGRYAQIASELVDIIRLRGLFDKPTRWEENNNLVWQGWQVTDNLIGPSEVQAFLRGSGPMAKTLTDDGLEKMIILMKIMHQKGED
jgi:hypothetical protein